jgi:hypothetical protein
MKIAIFVTLCALAAGSSFNATLHSSVFKPGEEYVYHYKGQVLSGIPKSSSQFAGLLIDSLVLVQFQQDYKVVMKMEKIKLYKINNKITVLPTEPLPESELTRLTGEQASVITHQLVKPIKFRYEKGEITELEKEISDEYWSVNIKKGVLSLFQVTLKEKTPYSSDSYYPDPLMSKVRGYNPRRNSRYTPITPYWKLVTKSNSAYKVMETDVLGNCESKYTLISDKDHITPSVSTMQVSRVKNFNNCVSKPFYIEGLFQGVYRYPTEKDLIEPTVHTDFIIAGDRSQFLIKDVKLRAKYFFLVNGLEGADVSTHIFQHLTLKTIVPISTPIHILSPKVDPKGLSMVIPKATLLPEKKSYEDTPINPFYRPRAQENFMKDSEFSEDIEEEETYPQSDVTSTVEMKLSELVSCLYPSTTDRKCSDILYEISRIVREMNKVQLKSLINKYIHAEHSTGSETEYRKAEILLDLLPTLPSPSAAKVLLELIKESKISTTRATLMITPMTLVVKPTPALIKNVLELFKELPKERTSTVTSVTMLRQSLLLGVGTLTHRLINVMRTQGKPVPEVINFIDSVSSELKRMLEETSSESEKILILKSLGNMGASETILTIKNVIEDPNQTPVVRVQAVFALRRLAKQFSKQVTPMLLGLFMDVKEIREIRQGAFVVLINSNPSYTTLQLMAHRIRHEPSSQLRTLVYTSIVNLATFTSHEPEHKTLVKNCRLILKTIPAVHVGIHDSMSLLLNKFSEQYDMGGSLNLIKIKSKLSGMPESLIANIQGTLFGKHRKIMEIGATGKSLELVLRKFFGPHGLLKQYIKGEFTLEDIFKPLSMPEMGPIQHKIRQILAKLMVEGRNELEPFGITSSLYMHLLGNELQYIVINSQNIQEVINKMTEYIPHMLMKLSSGVKVDIVKSLSHIASVNIATPLGVPLALNYTTMGILKITGFVKLTNMPSWSDMINRFSSLSVPHLGLELDLKPFVDMSHYVSMGPDMRWISPGVGASLYLKVKSPVKVIAQFNPIQHSLSVKYFTPKETEKAVYFKSTPMTFIKYTPTTISKLPFLLELNEIKGEHIVKQMPFTFKYQCYLSGLEIETDGIYSLCGPSWCPINPLFGKQEITIFTRPHSNVDFVQLKVKSLRSNIELEGVPSSYNTEELFVKDPEEYEEEQRMYNIHTGYRSENSRSMIESGEFEPINIDPIFSSEPVKRQVLVTFGPNTHLSPKVKVMATWLMSRQYWKNQFDLQIVRSGYNEMPMWKVHMNTIVNPLIWYPEMTYKSEPLSKMTLKWNINGQSNLIKFKIIPGSPFDFTRELEENSLMPTFVDNLPEATAQKYKYTVEVEVPQMSHKIMKYITVVHDAIKYQFYSKLTTVIPTRPLSDKVILAVEVLPWWEKMNVIVKTPREDSYISSIPLYWNPFHPTSTKMVLHDLPAWKWYKNTSDSEYFLDTVPYKSSPVISDKCIVSPQELRTFDGATIPMSMVSKNWEKNCEIVIAQHCTNEGLFSVVSDGDGQAWRFKMLVPKYEIVVVADMQRITTVVNGEEKHLSVGQPIVIHEHYSQSSPKDLVIEKVESGIVHIKSVELGIEIIVNGNLPKLTFKISPFSMLQGQICGACGNYNQDPSDDFYSPLSPSQLPPSDFQVENRDVFRLLTKYMLDSQTCNLENFKAKCNNNCMMESYLPINRFDNETPITCTSESKVPQCAPGCDHQATITAKTCFTCRGEEGVARRFSPAPWDTLEGVECSDFYQTVEIPTVCVPVY